MYKATVPIAILFVACSILALSLLNVPIAHGNSRTASAATWTVPGDFPTIQAALNAASAGDTILVASGVYTENLNFNSKAITLQSIAGPETTIINGNHTGKTVSIGPQGQIIGFKIINGQDYFGAGMAVYGTGTLIRGNIFADNFQYTGGMGAAINGNVASPIVDSNIFINNQCDNQFPAGVVTFGNDSSPQIINNIFRDNPCRAVNLGLPTGTAPLVSNNLFVGNSVGIRVDTRVNTAAQIYQNNMIISNTIGFQVEFGSPPNYPTVRNNLVFANTTNYDVIPDQTGQNGNISADPLFIDAAHYDYGLRPTSPAISAGTNVQCPATDFRGHPRPQGICEIGIYEYIWMYVPFIKR